MQIREGEEPRKGPPKGKAYRLSKPSSQIGLSPDYSLGTHWEPVRKVFSRAAHRPTESETVGVGPKSLCCNSPPGASDVQSVRTAALTPCS